MQHPVHLFQQGGDAQGLDDDAIGRGVQQLGAFIACGGGRDHEHRGVGAYARHVTCPHVTQYIQSVESRHPHVQQGEGESVTIGKAFERLESVAGARDVVSGPGEGVVQEKAVHRVVVCHEDAQPVCR